MLLGAEEAREALFRVADSFWVAVVRAGSSSGREGMVEQDELSFTLGCVGAQVRIT